MVGEAGAVVVLQHWMGSDEGLDDDVLDVPPQLSCVIAVLFHPGV